MSEEPKSGKSVAKDMTNQKIGRWHVKGRAENKHRGKRAWWTCVCKCGTERDIEGKSLRSGNTNSCGCIFKEKAKEIGASNAKHGMCGTRVYAIWSGMINRCHNTKDQAYARYGGRGILVCDEWRDSFEAFYEDMGDPPEGCSLDRIDNDKGYNASNCQWSSDKQQSRNRGDYNKRVVYQDREVTVGELAEIAGISYCAMWARIKAGWDASRAVDQPVRKSIGGKYV